MRLTFERYMGMKRDEIEQNSRGIVYCGSIDGALALKICDILKERRGVEILREASCCAAYKAR